jgi:hypothetical protein
MYRLLSFSDDEYSLKKFNGKAENVEGFLSRNSLDGLELMRWENPKKDAVPMGKVIGRHMPFWPIFLDFWREDHDSLLKQFDTAENYHGYYFAETKGEFINARRNELLDAAEMRVQYVVFHISHARLEDCYTGRFSYCDEEVINAFIELLNEILNGVSASYQILFENHWLPGLTFLDGMLAMKLLDRVAYPNKGFVLDISHLMNTNSSIKDEKEAVRYILEKMEQLGEARQYIRAIHLNSSILGTRKITGQYETEKDFMTRLISAMRHVGEMDPHNPFKDREILRVLDMVQPEYLVYELASKTLSDLHTAVTMQNDVLKVLSNV